MRYFIDTSALIALADRSDQYHASATDFFREEIDPSDQIYTSNYVLDETITRLRVSAGYHTAEKFAEFIYSSKTHQIQAVDREIEREALRFFKQYHDHEFSFTDCTTLVFLHRLAIPQLFAYDRVFQNVGCSLVPGF